MLEWKDPPPIPTEPIDHVAVADELRRHPGEWAIVQRNPSRPAAQQLARRIRDAVSAAYAPRGSFEARPVLGVVYARYVGHHMSDIEEQP